MRKINANMSATALLQSVRQFDVAAGLKERSLDAGAGPGQQNRGLTFRPIDFDALGLKLHPDLPPGNGAREKIKTFCTSPPIITRGISAGELTERIGR